MLLYSAFKVPGSDSTTDTYSYNPCYGFAEGDCENVAVS